MKSIIDLQENVGYVSFLDYVALYHTVSILYTLIFYYVSHNIVICVLQWKHSRQIALLLCALSLIVRLAF